MWNSIKRWLHDPFGKKSLIETHEPLIEELWKTKAEVNATISLLESSRHFPIASTIQRHPRR